MTKKDTSTYQLIDIETINPALMIYGTCQSIFGEIFIAKSEMGILAIEFTEGNYHACLERAIAKFNPYKVKRVNDIAKEFVNAYKEQDLDYLDNLKLLIRGTDFQRKVWVELANIPYGNITSYKQLANAIGNPKAVRAVANAVANNPISIMIPCHRVIHADGSLSGYRWGSDVKQKLLDWEASFMKSHA